MTTRARECGLVRNLETGHVYGQDAFRHLLAVERRRIGSHQSVLLILIALRSTAGARTAIDGTTASRLFSQLHASLREVDFAGWFRDSWVAGAVLIQGINRLPLGARDQVGRRVTASVIDQVPVTAGHELYLRVLQLRAQENRL
jgi:hypothetical protein